MPNTMDYATPTAPATPKWMKIVGWVLSILSIALPLSGAIMTLVQPSPQMKEGIVHAGYPEHLMVPLAILEGICAVVYLIPQTAVLGAILLTGYFGGAIATHVRIEEKTWLIAATMGVLAWLGLYFRDARVRALIPLRR